jgi:hypothetical protein
LTQTLKGSVDIGSEAITSDEVRDIGSSGVSYDHPAHVEVVVIVSEGILAGSCEERLDVPARCILRVERDMEEAGVFRKGYVMVERFGLGDRGLVHLLSSLDEELGKIR